MPSGTPQKKRNEPLAEPPKRKVGTSRGAPQVADAPQAAATVPPAKKLGRPPKQAPLPDDPFAIGISLLDEATRAPSTTAPVNLLRKLLISHAWITRFHLYSYRPANQELRDLVDNRVLHVSSRMELLRILPSTMPEKPFELTSRDRLTHWWCLPIHVGDTLVLSSEDPVDANPLVRRKLEFILKAWYARKAAQEERLLQERTLAQLRAIREIGSRIGKQYEVKQLLLFILTEAMKLVEAEKGHIMVFDEQRGELRLELASGINPEADRAINEGRIQTAGIRPGEGVQGRVFQSQEPVIQNQRGESLDEGPGEGERDLHSIICIPLAVQAVSYGVLYVTNKRNGQPFTEADLDVVSILSSKAAALIDQDKLLRISITDHLTGLYTRRYFEPKMQEELMRTQRYQRPFSLMAIDIDFFKKVNDTYGHQAGDKILTSVGDILRGAIRQHLDIAVRFGGEEFFVCLPETASEGALRVAERIRKTAAENLVPWEGLKIGITVSIGLATAPQDGTTPEELIRAADLALYASKQHGRDQVTLFRKGMEITE